MDLQIAYTLLSACSEAALIIGEEDTMFLSELHETLEHIPQPSVGSHGQIKEWLFDYEEQDAGQQAYFSVVRITSGGTD